MKLEIHNGKYLAITKYGEWAAKEAGFKWDAAQKVWWTDDPAKAEAIQRATGLKFLATGMDAPSEEYAAKSPVHAEIEATAKTLTQHDIQLIHHGLRIVAGKCDYATTRDKRGFGKWDAELGHKLADETTLTARQAAWGKRLLKTYRRQLPGELIEALWPTAQEVA